MTTLITQTTINPIVPANAALNYITLSEANSPVALVYPATFVQSPYYLAAAIIVNQAEGFFGGTISMPNALIITQSIVCNIINVSPNVVNIKNFDGGEIVVIDPGQSVLLYLLPQDVPSSAGNWYTTTIGTGTSGADASALAGYGLLALANKLNCIIDNVDEEFSITMNNELDAKLINWIGGTYNLNLDSLVDPIEGFYILVKNSSPSNGILTLEASDIDGGTSVSLSKNQSCFVIYMNETNVWRTVGLGSLDFGNAVQFTEEGIRLINGTAAEPSLAYISQPTTGLFSNGETDVSVTNGGTESMSFKSEGIILKTGKYKFGDDDMLEYLNIYPEVNHECIRQQFRRICKRHSCKSRDKPGYD